MKRLTQEQFIAKARAIHGDKYDYSKVVYVNERATIIIGCPIHGWFNQKAGEHMHGKGCAMCGFEKSIAIRTHKPLMVSRKVKYGVAYNDYDGCIMDENGKVLMSYQVWDSMIKRCYSKKHQLHAASYIGCRVCDEWLRYSNFKKWFDGNYVDGYQLDKDILVKDNKIYSPDTCCFVPKRINSLFVKSYKQRNLPAGVWKSKNQYLAKFVCGDIVHYLGLFKTIDEASAAYKKDKEKVIKEFAQEYYDKGLIDVKIYDAMLNYKI